MYLMMRELDKLKSELSPTPKWQISRYKGLGEMNAINYGKRL